MRSLLLINLGLLAALTTVWGQDEPRERVGRDTCLMCHEVSNGFLTSPHASVECESCHGPGSAHVDSGGDTALIRTPTASDWPQTCLTCHATGAGHLADFMQSQHGANQVSCLDCHQVHSEKSVFKLLKQPANELCISCHKATEATFRKPFHHPVLEGGMKCIDCHDPHAEPSQAYHRLDTFAQYGCTSCHADKKGPFVFPHPAVEEGGCMTCHEPMGSFNSKMLVRSQVYQLCLECHTRTPGVASSQPPAFHDIRSPRYRNCTICHREIHGSNVNPLFLR
ncbi:MAG: DmsE family decaheme c-type cytochrome [Acidobacteriota bacterium]